MADARRSVGARGETAVLERYRRSGYRVVERNWRCSLGELDLVVSRGDVLVICEVKTRRGSRLGAGFEAVDARKRRKLRSLAEVFVLTHDLRPGSVRFDVASVGIHPFAGPGLRVDIEVFEDAF
jgi:putative endonuclease